MVAAYAFYAVVYPGPAFSLPEAGGACIPLVTLSDMRRRERVATHCSSPGGHLSFYVVIILYSKKTCVFCLTTSVHWLPTRLHATCLTRCLCLLFNNLRPLATYTSACNMPDAFALLVPSATASVTTVGRLHFTSPPRDIDVLACSRVAQLLPTFGFCTKSTMPSRCCRCGCPHKCR